MKTHMIFGDWEMVESMLVLLYMLSFIFSDSLGLSLPRYDKVKGGTAAGSPLRGSDTYLFTLGLIVGSDSVLRISAELGSRSLPLSPPREISCGIETDRLKSTAFP